MSRTTRWSRLSTPAKAAIIAGGALDAGLRIWAVTDLRGRSTGEVRGPKSLWLSALALVSSGGVLPAAYLLVGRRHR